jgi:hypothetical protein
MRLNFKRGDKMGIRIIYEDGMTYRTVNVLTDKLVDFDLDEYQTNGESAGIVNPYWKTKKQDEH